MYVERIGIEVSELREGREEREGIEVGEFREGREFKE